jgi:predicted dehydrogenase
MHFEATIRDGVSFHGTTWRTVPEYQGGFILDGGVHWAAMLRIVLPETCRPVFVTAYKSLHRSHILPHDTVVGIVHPAHSATHEPCGSPTSVKAEITADEMPVKPGKSTPHGTFILSWAAPDTPAGSRPPNELYIVAEHGTVRIVNTGGKWNAKLYPTDSTGLQEATLDGPATGVEEELADYARAVAAVRVGKTDDKANNAEPRAALWDLAFVEAALTSDGKKMTIAYE